MEEFYIADIGGILHFRDTPLVDFKIYNRTLEYAVDLSNRCLYPFHLAVMGLNYGAFNAFFNDRVVRKYAQDMRDYLDSMGMRRYIPEELVKKMNGWNALDNFWVKFPGIGANSWEEVLTQTYPIY